MVESMTVYVKKLINDRQTVARTASGRNVRKDSECVHHLMLPASDHEQELRSWRTWTFRDENLPTEYTASPDAVTLAAQLKRALVGSFHITLQECKVSE